MHKRICNRIPSGSDGTLHGLTATLVLPHTMVTQYMLCKPMPVMSLLEMPEQSGHLQF